MICALESFPLAALVAWCPRTASPLQQSSGNFTVVKFLGNVRSESKDVLVVVCALVANNRSSHVMFLAVNPRIADIVISSRFGAPDIFIRKPTVRNFARIFAVIRILVAISAPVMVVGSQTS